MKSLRLTLTLALVAIAACAASQTTIRASMGFTGFPDYGFGGTTERGEPILDAMLPFGTWRHFVDPAEYQTPGEAPRFHPNFKGRKIDRYASMVIAEDIFTLWCFSGSLKDQDVAHDRPLKGLPVAKGDDPYSPESYYWYAELWRQFVIRYGTHVTGDRMDVYKDPDNPDGWFSTPDLVGLGLVGPDRGACQVGNEVNFLWGVDPIGDEGMAAAMFYQSRKTIREESDSVPIIAGSMMAVDTSWLVGFIEAFDSICISRGERPPRDWALSYHEYLRVSGEGQAGGSDDLGASPEQAGAYWTAVAVRDISDRYGLEPPWYTEWGWNDDPVNSGSLKQLAPLQEGFDHQESMGLMLLRTHLLMQSVERFGGATAWHSRDLYDGFPFAFAGIHYKTNDWQPVHPVAGQVEPWSDKPAKLMLVDFLDTWGDWHVVRGSYVHNRDNTHQVEVAFGNQVETLIWSDGNSVVRADGTLVTPMPSPVDHPSPGGTITVTEIEFPGYGVITLPAPIILKTQNR